MLIKKVDEIIKLYIDFIKKQIYIKERDLEFQFYVSEDAKRTTDNIKWSKVEIPFYIFDEKKYYYFRTIYENVKLDNKKKVLIFDIEGEFNVLINGKYEFGVDMMHKIFNISDILDYKNSQTFCIDLEFYSGHWVKSATNSFRSYSKDQVILSHKSTKDEYPVIFKGISEYHEDISIKNFYYDLVVLYEIALSLPENSLRRNNILCTLYKALNSIDINIENRELLLEQITKIKPEIDRLLKCKNSTTTPMMGMIGHAHIDLAWLWTKDQGKRKIIKTFTTMIKFINDYPEFIFLQSQSLFLEIVCKTDKKLIKEIINAYKNGNWEPCGCMYVEPDCNLISGESLIRQLLIGSDIFNEYFQYSSNVAWLPDAFGFSPCLPQVLKGFNIEYLVTHKIIWNDTNKFPYDLFNWCGNDSSSIKVAVITGRMCGYSGKVNIECINDTWNNIQHKDIQNRSILPIGLGDGGGGTTIDDLEYARRINDLEGCAKSKWTKVENTLNKMFSENTLYPEYKGEIYFERHRGAYTTQGRVKWWNRKLEFLLREFEYVLSYIYEYLTNDELRLIKMKTTKMWKKLLENQSHDIIAGTCINDVYVDLENEYKSLKNEILISLVEQLSKLNICDNNIYLINNYNWQFCDLICFPINYMKFAEDKPIQETYSIDGLKVFYAKVKLEQLSICSFEDSYKEFEIYNDKFSFNNNVLMTPFYKVIFNEYGGITCLYDLSNNREYIIPNSVFNEFQLFQDIPVRHDAWDVDVYYREKKINIKNKFSMKIISKGSLFIQLRIEGDLGYNSFLSQDIFFYAHTNRIDFKTKILWNEQHTLLKVAFPINIETNMVDCDMQYGYITRNIELHKAMFEFIAHKWVRLAGSLYSISIISDSKYGWDYYDNAVRLSVLRSSKVPDAFSDIGEHYFSYSFLPEDDIGEISRQAYNLNNSPLIFIKNGDEFIINQYSSRTCNCFQDVTPKVNNKVEKMMQLISLSNNNIVLDTIKLANDGNGGIILRLYNPLIIESITNIKVNYNLEAAYYVNLKEEEYKKIKVQSNIISVKMNKFQLITIKLIFKF